MKEEPNILFIVIDALRARNLGCYGYSKPTSPNIDNLAKEGILFENAYSCATTTFPSLATIFSGRYPLSHGITRHSPTSIRQDMEKLDKCATIFLPEILRAKGYSTVAVDWLGGWHRRGYDYYSGFINPHKVKLYRLFFRSGSRLLFRSRYYPMITQLLKWKSIDDANVVTNKAINLVGRIHNKKFFLFIHYWDTHIPYNPPKCYLDRFDSRKYGNNQTVKELFDRFDRKHSYYLRMRIPGGVKNTNQVLARYDGEISFVDHQIGRLIETLENYEISEKTLIVLTSDHGESLTEHGIYFGHHGLYDVTIHVPLIFSFSTFPKNKRIEGLVQHTDILPTILHVLGMNSKKHGIDGKSVIPLIYGETKTLRKAAYVEEADAQRKRAIRTSEYKYICSLEEKDTVCRACGYRHGEMEELYDFSEDPEEDHNVIKENLNLAHTLREEIFKWEKSLKSRKEQKEFVSKEIKNYYSEKEEKMVRERLKDLGYL